MGASVDSKEDQAVRGREPGHKTSSQVLQNLPQRLGQGRRRSAGVLPVLLRCGVWPQVADEGREGCGGKRSWQGGVCGGRRTGRQVFVQLTVEKRAGRGV